MTCVDDVSSPAPVSSCGSSPASSTLGLSAASVADPSEPQLVLWNTARYASLRPELADRRHVTWQHEGRLVGSLTATARLDPQRGRREWVSGWYAPFGGVDLGRDHERVDLVDRVVEAAVDAARADDADVLVVNTKPPHWSASEAYVNLAWFARGASVATTHLNAWVDLRPFTDGAEYEASLRKETRRALRAARGLGLAVEVLDGSDERGWAAGYDVIARNRREHDRPMHLSLDALRSVRDAFGPLVRMLTVQDPHSGQIVAASVVYRIGRGRDYVVYWGDAGHDLRCSPMPLLAVSVLRHALEHGAELVDLGISSEQGQANPGLVQFKRSVGAQLELRHELRLALR